MNSYLSNYSWGGDIRSVRAVVAQEDRFKAGLEGGPRLEEREEGGVSGGRARESGARRGTPRQERPQRGLQRRLGAASTPPPGSSGLKKTTAAAASNTSPAQGGLHGCVATTDATGSCEGAQ